jgi:ribosome recycling factor
MAEEARVRVRANRRTAVDDARKMQKAGDLTEDGLHDLEANVQKLTDKSVKQIDDHLERKEAEVMKI